MAETAPAQTGGAPPSLMTEAASPKTNTRASISKVGGRRASAAFAAPVPKLTLRYMPTYRLEPKNRFNTETCEKILKTVMDDNFHNFTYAPKLSLNLSAQVSEEIKNRVKSHNFDRYRYVCVVTVGEKVMQGYYSLVNFLWDAEKDGYVSYVYDKPNFFAIATLYYLYYD